MRRFKPIGQLCKVCMFCVVWVRQLFPIVQRHCVGLTGDSELPEAANMILPVSVSSVIDRGPVQGAPCLSPYDWDRLK